MPIFSLHDLELIGLKVYPYQLSNWVDKNYLIKLKNGLYTFRGNVEKLKCEQISFYLYQPSYISLEKALSHYGLIPEMVYNCTSVTPKITRTFRNELGVFIFKHIKKELFFGYQQQCDNNDELPYLMAEPEKALLDYLYFNLPQLKDKKDVEELRINEIILKDLNKSKIKKYAQPFQNTNMQKILKLLL